MLNCWKGPSWPSFIFSIALNIFLQTAYRQTVHPKPAAIKIKLLGPATFLIKTLLTGAKVDSFWKSQCLKLSVQQGNGFRGAQKNFSNSPGVYCILWFPAARLT